MGTAVARATAVFSFAFKLAQLSILLWCQARFAFE